MIFDDDNDKSSLPGECVRRDFFAVGSEGEGSNLLTGKSVRYRSLKMVEDVYHTGYCGNQFDCFFSRSNLNFGPVLDRKMEC